MVRRTVVALILGHTDSKDLFALTLGLSKPWSSATTTSTTAKRLLEISIDFERSGVFPWLEFGKRGC